jgi:hypothetical protein
MGYMATPRCSGGGGLDELHGNPGTPARRRPDDLAAQALEEGRGDLADGQQLVGEAGPQDQREAPPVAPVADGPPGEAAGLEGVEDAQQAGLGDAGGGVEFGQRLAVALVACSTSDRSRALMVFPGRAG